MIQSAIPLLGFCAFSGTGKTTLLISVLPLLKNSGLRVTVIKHAHHNFDVDYPEKDSYKIRKSGAEQVMVISRKRLAIIREFEAEHEEPTLAEALDCLDHREVDLILVEGFKKEAFPKIELHRASLGHPLMCTDDPNIIALASDTKVPAVPRQLPSLDLNTPQTVVDFILEYAGISASFNQPRQLM